MSDLLVDRRGDSHQPDTRATLGYALSQVSLLVSCHSDISLTDQWGEIDCPFPVILSFHVECANAASAPRDIETRLPWEPHARPYL